MTKFNRAAFGRPVFFGPWQCYHAPMNAPLIPFRELPGDRQLALREAYADVMARSETTCSLDEKISRFAAWLEPQGISFTKEDLPGRK